MTSGTIILDKSTVVILINASFLKHKSTLHEGLREQSFWTKVQ